MQILNRLKQYIAHLKEMFADLSNPKEPSSEKDKKDSSEDKFVSKMSDKGKAIFGKFTEDYEFGYRGTSKTSHKLLWFSAIFIIIALVWSYYATLEEVTTATGKVIPSKQMQVIQNLEGGIVNEILVHQGEMVQKGQVIAYLDKTRFESDYNNAKQRYLALQLKVTRLEAQVNNKPFVVSPEMQKASPDLSASEMALYQTQIHELEVLQGRRALIEKEISMTEPLIKSGDVSRVEMIHLQESLDDIDNQILVFKSTALDDLNKTKADFESLSSEMEGLQDKLARTTIKSPVKGIINEIYVNTVGGVIKPGDNLIDIVPLGDTLLIEAKLRPSDIGFVHIGQQTNVKITAYDYSIYGGLPGIVEYISSDTIKDERGEQFYQIHVRTQQNYLLGKDKQKLYIIPGMTATVDILTGHKTVLDYILKPILKARQSALHER